MTTPLTLLRVQIIGEHPLAIKRLAGDKEHVLLEVISVVWHGCDFGFMILDLRVT